MRYLADTNVFVDHFRGRHKMDKRKAKQGISISIITFGELLYGACKSADREKSLKVVYEFFKDLSIEILNLNKKIMFEYAQIKAELEVSGKRLDDFDLLIGATAKIHNLALLTRNKRHFKRIPGLKIA